jgi:hypothetical protein
MCRGCSAEQRSACTPSTAQPKEVSPPKAFRFVVPIHSRVSFLAASAAVYRHRIDQQLSLANKYLACARLPYAKRHPSSTIETLALEDPGADPGSSAR